MIQAVHVLLLTGNGNAIKFHGLSVAVLECISGHCFVFIGFATEIRHFKLRRIVIGNKLLLESNT